MAKFLVEQARGNTHAPANSQEEDALLSYNYHTTFTGKVSFLQLQCCLPWILRKMQHATDVSSPVEVLLLPDALRLTFQPRQGTDKSQHIARSHR